MPERISLIFNYLAQLREVIYGGDCQVDKLFSVEGEPSNTKYINLVCKDSPSLKSWFLGEVNVSSRAVRSPFLFNESTVRALPVTSLSALYYTPHSNF